MPRGVSGMRRDVTVAAADLEHVARFLRELSQGICEPHEAPEEPEEPEKPAEPEEPETPEGPALRREAEGWAERLGRVAGEMRAAVRSAE